MALKRCGHCSQPVLSDCVCEDCSGYCTAAIVQQLAAVLHTCKALRETSAEAPHNGINLLQPMCLLLVTTSNVSHAHFATLVSGTKVISMLL